MKTALRIKMTAEKDFPSNVIAVSVNDKTDPPAGLLELGVQVSGEICVASDSVATRSLSRGPHFPNCNWDAKKVSTKSP
jgi:hypothetical protein